MEIRKVIRRILNGDDCPIEEKREVFSYLRHIPNARKTEDEWNLYVKMAEEKGLPKPDRNSRIRPLHENKNY